MLARRGCTEQMRSDTNGSKWKEEFQRHLPNEEHRPHLHPKEEHQRHLPKAQRRLEKMCVVHVGNRRVGSSLSNMR